MSIPFLRGIVLAASLAGATAISAGSRIELSDGSVLLGDVVDINGGQYVIETDTLGRVQIDGSRIQLIRPCSPCQPDSTGAAGNASLGTNGGLGQNQSQIQDIQMRLVADPSAMSSILTLQQDSDIQRALADPQLMQRVMSGDVESLQTDPTFHELMNHPAIRSLVRGMQR